MSIRTEEESTVARNEWSLAVMEANTILMITTGPSRSLSNGRKPYDA